MPPSGVPSGNTSEAVRAYYTWIWTQYHAAIPLVRINMDWTGPLWIFIFAASITIFWWLYVRFAIRVHRKRGELYGVMSFGGVILERIGPVEVFTWVFSLGMIAWCIYLVWSFIFYGMLY